MTTKPTRQSSRWTDRNTKAVGSLSMKPGPEALAGELAGEKEAIAVAAVAAAVPAAIEAMAAIGAAAAAMAVTIEIDEREPA